MKIEQSSHRVKSNMTGEKIALGLSNDAEDMAHILSVLTDLYKNRLLAVIREYSTNALDAHIEAGISLPIEVKLPSSFNPILSIRDYGVGLSLDDVRSVYTQYGRSTKRGSNDQVGMLGLGCKSALTYTNQFTVVSTKDGRKITALVARDQEGSGSMQILQDIATDEANGTEIQVVVGREDVTRCVQLAEDFYKFWQPGTVTVNGESPERFKGQKLTENLYMIPREASGYSRRQRSSDTDIIVMGNVAYPQALDIDVPNRNFDVVAFVPIGTVKPTPSRESLMDTQRTKDSLKKVADDFRNVLDGAIQKSIDAATTHADALQALIAWQEYLPNKSGAHYTYRGVELPTKFEIQGTGSVPPRIEVAPWHTRKLSNTNYATHVEASAWPTTIWVTNFAPGKFTAQHKHKLTKWAVESGFEASDRYRASDNPEKEVGRFVLLPGGFPSNPFIKSERIISWDVVKKTKLDTASSDGIAWNAGRIPGSYDVWTENGWKPQVRGSDIRQDKPLLWAEGNRYATKNYHTALSGIHPEFTLVSLPANRVNKFKRDVPKAVNAHAGVVAGYKAWLSKITFDDKMTMVIERTGENHLLCRLDEARINDPKVVQSVKWAKRDIQAIEAQHAIFTRVIGLNDLDKSLPTWENPLKKYPLYYLNNAYRMNGEFMDATYEYMNMMFEHGKAT